MTLQIDLFVVPTLSFRLLYGLLILGHGRRQILWLGVTAHPPAAGNAQRATSSAIATGSMAKFSPGGFALWVFVTGQPHPNHPGRMDIRNG